uniref:AlNc14C268G9925 protein n=1 Tax=Albugo laibachii Nc14 TaxID=890382 RepID=F0WUA4_9STRA|nr:AlNc14C268G9925 [Albugo laibachii Nc14]CCA26520.1 AlNc14C381G11226 [Albugo laibachii Nc14]|eukprot:CCA26520.1 AlNc14C381G11226 [Albugo laibachii Nc14]
MRGIGIAQCHQHLEEARRLLMISIIYSTFKTLFLAVTSKQIFAVPIRNMEAQISNVVTRTRESPNWVLMSQISNVQNASCACKFEVEQWIALLCLHPKV